MQSRAGLSACSTSIRLHRQVLSVQRILSLYSRTSNKTILLSISAFFQLPGDKFIAFLSFLLHHQPYNNIIYCLSKNNPPSKKKNAITKRHHPRIHLPSLRHDSRQHHVHRPSPISPPCNFHRDTRSTQSYPMGIHDGQLHRLGGLFLSNQQSVFIIGKCTGVDIECVA